ncbi:MAG: zinc-finger domain-containing protein [Henriciella sp.]|uniref:zinc-finger domain-containing protein n=1 Tax=Henriciella sp. TaxID=1968823 RepID=UPI00262D53DC|nr:zinc-finger domain-containing protein [Henriciella sp.]
MSTKPLPEAPETIITDEHRVACDGGNGPLGHPIVWYEMGDDEMVECGYCDRRFVLRGGRFDPEAQQN